MAIVGEGEGVDDGVVFYDDEGAEEGSEGEGEGGEGAELDVEG